MKPLLAVAILILSSISFAQEPESWIDSAEAYFATKAEREQWAQLPDRAQRDAFKARYWKRRDPSPATERNEFRDVILDRIRKADAKFPIAERRGSMTARGFAFVVFGPPARIRGTVVEPLERPRPGQLPDTPIGNREGTERNEVWIYDRERTPNLLQMLNRPGLEITIIVEPNKQRDVIQNPGLANQLRDVLAERSIVSDAEPSMAKQEVASAAEPLEFDSLSSAPLSNQESSLFDSSAGDAGTQIDVLVMWREAGSSEIVIAAFVPEGRNREKPTIHVRIRNAMGEIVGSVSKSASASTDFFASQPGIPLQLRLSLPPGSYEADLVVVDDSRNPIAAAHRAFEIPVLDAFSVSSLMLAGGVEVGEGPTRLFRLGPLHTRPRVDAAFLPNESLWYVIEIANPSSPEAVTLEARLRHEGKPVGSTGIVPASLERIGPGRFIAARELPLIDYEAGAYTLYVIVRDASQEEVRRADFRIIVR